MMKQTKTVGKKVNREEEDFIRDLRRRNELLQKENKTLQGRLKNASFAVQKYKNQLHSLKCRYSGSRSTFSKSTSSRSTISRRYNNNSSDDEEDKFDNAGCGARHRRSDGGCKISVNDVNEIRHEYDEDVNAVLSQLQQRLLDTQNENSELKNKNEQLQRCKMELDEIHQSRTKLYQGESNEMQTLRQELNEAMENLRTMNVQYNNLETNAQVQLDVQKQTRLKLEQCNAYIMKLQNEIQVLRSANESAKRNERKVEEQKEHVQDLLEENKLLEDNLSKLCELPFVQDDEPALVSTDHVLEEQVIELEARDVNNQETIKELKEENETLVGSISALEDKCYQLETDNDQLHAEIYEFKQNRLDMEDEETQTDPAVHQLKNNNRGTQTLSVHVSSEIKPKSKFDRSSQTYGAVDFRLEHDTEVDSSSEHNKMMDQGSRLDESSHEASTQMDKLSNDHDDLTEGESFDENQLSGENMFEIVIKRAELNERFFSDEVKTMVTLDYLDYETMVSNVVRGRFPQYAFGIKYDLSDRKLDKLKKFTVLLRLYKVTSSTEYEAIATLTLNLMNVIDCNGCNLSGTFELVSTESDEDIVGEIEVVAKLKESSPKKNESFSPIVKTVENHSEYKEDMQETKGDNMDISQKHKEEQIMVKSNMSSILKYFITEEDQINYIDFLRFVDPPYPILKQIRFLQKIETELTDILKSSVHSDSSDVRSGDERKHHISEEIFVQAVATQASSTRNIQLDEVCNLYRHLDMGNDNTTTSHRILFFLYSSEMEELRRIFFSFRKSSIDPWRPFQLEDVERTGTVSKATFNECIRSIGIGGLVIL